MDKEKENLLKQNYINEQIIEKGYNPEDLSNFVSRTRGVKVEELPLKILMKSIEHFKNEKLNQTYSSFTNVKSVEKQEPKKPKEKEVPLFDIFYSPNSYELTCKAQEDNPLNILEKQNVKPTIEVSEPKKVQTGGLFGNTTYVYKVSCKDINSTVFRTYQDFEWLNQKLMDQYPLRYIPPIKKFKIFEKENDESVNTRIRYINKFFDAVCRKKIIRTSLLLYAFLTLPDEKFLKLKSQKENLYTLNKDMSNLINYSGKVTFDLTKEKAIYMNALQRLLTPTIDYYDKLNTAIDHLATDFNNITLHTKELSDIITHLEVEAKKLKIHDNMKKAYAYLSESLFKISDVFSKQKEIFNTDLKEYFDYMKLEYIQISSLTRSFDVTRSNYEDYVLKLKNKKDALYLTKNVTKWEMDPDDRTDFDTLKEDKKLAYEKMCYKENLEAEELKKTMTLVMNMILSQHDKVCKYQDERITGFIEKFKEKYNKFGEVNLNFIKLISEML